MRAVREAACQDADLEAGSDVLDAREGRMRLDDIDARQVGVRVGDELIVDVGGDARDRRRVEKPALYQDHAALRNGRIRKLERAERLCRLREKRRHSEYYQDGENQAAGNPSPHNPNLPENDLPVTALATCTWRRSLFSRCSVDGQF